MPRPEALKKDYIKHRVDYLGALPISNRSTNLAALQRPLKDLYFRYREQRNVGQSNLPGTLEINDTGLRVQYIRELHKGVQGCNPCPSLPHFNSAVGLISSNLAGYPFHLSI